MSASTKDALMRAVREHLADERGPDAYPAAVVIGIEYTSIELEQTNQAALLNIAPDGQSWTTSLGIAEALTQTYRPALAAYIVG